MHQRRAIVKPFENNKFKMECDTRINTYMSPILPGEKNTQNERSIECNNTKPKRTSTAYTLVCESIIHNEITYKLKWRSCTFFLLGGLFYTLQSVLDIVDIKYYEEMDDDDGDGDDAFYLDLTDTISIPMYSLVYGSAALSYVISAFIDFTLISMYSKNKSSSIPKEILSTNDGSIEDVRKSSITSLSKSSVTKRVKSVNSNMLSVLFFGIAAFIDLIAAFIYLPYPYQSDLLSGIACPIYFLEAIFAVCGRFSRPKDATHYDDDSTYSSSESSTHEHEMVYCLDTIGDILFLVGAIIDVVIGYYYLIPKYDDSMSLAYWSLGSNILWLIDGILYMSAEVLYDRYDGQLHSSTEVEEWEYFLDR